MTPTLALKYLARHDERTMSARVTRGTNEFNQQTDNPSKTQANDILLFSSFCLSLPFSGIVIVDAANSQEEGV